MCVQDGSKKFGITAGLLMCFMTELGPDGAEECLQQVSSACNGLLFAQSFKLCAQILFLDKLPDTHSVKVKVCLHLSVKCLRHSVYFHA